MINRSFTKLVRLLKNKNFQLDPNVDSFYLIQLSLSKILELLRGIIKLRKVVFLGKAVVVYSNRQLVVGKSVMIGAYSLVNCTGENGIKIGSSSSIGRFSSLSVSGSISDLGKGIIIGNNVGIGDFAHIGGAGGVEIGSDTIVGHNFSVHPENHNISDLDKPIRLQGVNRKGIVVGRNCWIGAKVTLLDGCSIGEGCVVAAGSVVRGNYPDNVIIAGVPAKIIKTRS
ncbi:acyltransferase [Pseudoalteromonas sp. ZZD1]|uniref:acyltransferase n=1 Tax=Pseudoalteromonas sp. ZZD1 TaxID=3139395 RepID=UPI003BA89889